MNTERPTPRTDEVAAKQEGQLCGGANLNFARTLERELAEAREELARLNKMRTHCERCGGDYMATGVEVGCPCNAHPEPLPRPDGPDVFLSQYFQDLRMNPKHTLGLGDIRLTYGQQEELVYRNCAPKKEGEG